MSPGASRVKISIASWSPMKSEPLTVSYAWISGESSAAFPSAALMPPSAAPEWLRVGWSFEMTATSAPASYASIAARMPAQPAPTTRTSWVASTRAEASATAGVAAASGGNGLDDPQRPVAAVDLLRAVDLGDARADEPPPVEHGPASAPLRHEGPRPHLPVHLDRRLR